MSIIKAAGLGISLTTLALIAIALIRTLSIGATDLVDPTESRYAFVAQEMVISGDWLTPKLPLPTGIEPYTGKPPLHFWLTAICISVFGMDAWVTRLPSILGMLIIAACVWLVAQNQLSDTSRKLAVAITLTAGLFFFIAGSSTIDITFSAWISAAIAAFAVAGQERPQSIKRLAGFGFFAALALAFLTKGPASFILVGATIAFWMCKREHWQHFPRLPWVLGSALFLLIAAPWFILSAQKDPGFLHYFFVQENFLRFVSKNYGDRFGTGHVYPRGSALWMLVVGFLPWSFVLGYVLVRSKNRLQTFRSQSPGILLALSWGLAPALFFSFARQLHAAYLLPGFGGVAIVLAKLIEEYREPQKLTQLFRVLRVLTLPVSLGILVVSLFFNVTLIGFAIGAALMIAIYLVSAKTAKLENTTHAALAWALSVCLMYGLTLSAFGSHVGRIKSARFAISQIATQLQSDDRKITFLSHNSYSFYYYPRAWRLTNSPSVETDYATLEEVIANPPQNLVINNADVARISTEVLSKYQEVQDFGKWSWWQKN